MDISSVNFSGFVNKAEQKRERSVFAKHNECDSCTFSTKKIKHTKEEAIENAYKLKEEMEDHYGSITAESTLQATGVKHLSEDYEDHKTYMTLDEEEDINGKITGKSAVFDNGKISEIRIYKTKGAAFLGTEKYYFDKETGDFKRYVASTRNGYFDGVPVDITSTTEVEYEF